MRELEVKQHFKRVVRQLKVESQRFDAGDWEAAYPISNHLHLLLFTGRSRTISLLEQMDYPGDICFPDSTEMEGLKQIGMPLLHLNASEARAQFYPALSSVRDAPLKSFKRWYHGSVYAQGSLRLTRCELVKSMRDQDGGTHVDKKITSAPYALLKTDPCTHFRYFQTSKGIAVSLDGFELHFVPEKPRENEKAPKKVGESLKIENAEVSTIRQIAEEVLVALDSEWRRRNIDVSYSAGVTINQVHIAGSPR